ncbi:MAG: hypothetical protein RIR09_53 [Pseudomonadota bacterium]
MTKARKSASTAALNPPQLSDAILEMVLSVPTSHERARTQPEDHAYKVARSASRTASVISGSLSLPPGLLGWVTVVPELVSVWRVQAQMVSDIAAIYGKHQTLGREQMLYCLFKHVSAQLFRDVVVRVGERVIVHEASMQFLQTAAKKVGVIVTRSLIRKGAARFVPLLGAVTVGAYAYYDTMQVAKTAIDLFAHNVVIDNGDVIDVTAITL